MKLLDKERLSENIEKIASYDFDNKKVFGSAYWVYQNGEVVFNKCYGKTSFNSLGAVTETTLFRLASMTKPITAVAVLILVEKGLLSLSDKVSKYIPEFADIHVKALDSNNRLNDLGKPLKEPTIANLLSHCSGIDETQKSQIMTVDDKKSIDSLISFYIKSGLDYSPEEKQAYSGVVAFDVVTSIIEKVTDRDYQSFLKEYIFEPLGMNDTVFTPDEEQWSRIIAMHNKDGEEYREEKMHENCIFGDYPCTHYLGGAGLVSTLSDYSKFAKMLLDNGKYDGKVIVSEDTLANMYTPQVSRKIMDWCEMWGLGVRVIVDTEYKNLPVGAFGWSGAYGSHFWIDRENKVAAVFMKNSFFDGGSGNESARNFEKAVADSFK